MYKVAFKVLSPIHIGYRKYGNVMETRHYVPARVLLGALTARLTHRTFGNTKDWKHYRLVGELLNRVFTCSYFFPTTNPDGIINQFPWDEQFPAYEFIGSYVSTALNAQTSAAQEGTLHEVEFITPRTLHSSKQVYLSGYCFMNDSFQESKITQVIQNIQKELQSNNQTSFSTLPPKEQNQFQKFLNLILQNPHIQIIQKLSQSLQQLQYELRTGNTQSGLLHHLQIGGERTYGWGKITLSASLPTTTATRCMFEESCTSPAYPICLSEERPTLTVQAGEPIPLHLLYEPGSDLAGTPEPLTRTLWWAPLPTSFEGIAYPPGTPTRQELAIQIGRLGYGHPANHHP